VHHSYGVAEQSMKVEDSMALERHSLMEVLHSHLGVPHSLMGAGMKKEVRCSHTRREDR